MAPPRTKTPKIKVTIFIEEELAEHARKLSKIKGSFHHNVGSTSEAIRKGYKAWLKEKFPYLLKTTSAVDWNDVY
jgi:hypothetical protein